MDLKPEIHVKQTQKLVMTPQLRQAIKMLQLSNMELNERIEQELEENPALELEESENGYKNEVLDSEINSQVNNMDQSGPEGEFDKGYLYEDPSAYSADRSREDKKREFLEGAVSRAQTLKEYLREQIGLMDLEPQDYAAAEILISYIDSMGYLTADLEEISTTTGISLEELEKALQVVHSLDPPGVGARDIKECLLIQLKNKQNNPAAEKIVNECLNEIKLRKFSEISRKTGIPLAKVKEAFHIISSLEPYPGRNFFSESIEYVIPDIVVKEIDGKLEIITNNDFIPRMRVNKYYQNLLRSENVDKRVKEFVSEKLQRARGFIHSVEQRGNTLLRVTNAILEEQKDFFKKGPMHLKPLTLKDISSKVDLHESTVSRITSSKYIQTPFGIFPLKYFFSNSILAQGRKEYSSTSIKEIIKEIIQNEGAKKHLSDQKIADLLKKRGVNLARRTVAKYRKELNILPSNLRR